MPKPTRQQFPSTRRRRAARCTAALACIALLASCGSSGSSSPSEQGADRCRQVEHLGGTACVPADPQRIVVLDPFTVLPTLLDLDAPVVGATSVYPQGDPFPAYIEPQAAADIEIVGSALAPNLDAIATLEPDLIIAMSAAVTEVEEHLAQIAPTVITRFAFYTADWRQDVRQVAALVGATDAIDEMLADLDARSEAIADRLAADEPPTISTITISPQGTGYYRYGCTWIGEVLRRAGVDQPEAQDGDDCDQDDPASTVIPVSPELIPVLDADAIVAFAQPSRGGSPAPDPFTTLAENPLWGSLGAVESGQLFALGEPWGYGGSIAAALLVLDDLDDVIFPGS